MASKKRDMLDVPNHLLRLPASARAELTEREADHLAALAEGAEKLKRNQGRTRSGARKVLTQIGAIGNGIGRHRQNG